MGPARVAGRRVGQFPDGSESASIYMNSGTCYDLMKNPTKAIEVYNEGISKYPTVSLLYFNKAITLFNSGNVEEAMTTTESAIRYNPYHASSHNILALSTANSNKVYSLLAGLYFLAAEPLGKRASGRLKVVEELIGSNVKKDGEKKVNISMPAGDKIANKPNDFSSVELMMSMSAALSYSDSYKDETNIEQMKRNLGSIFGVLSETTAAKGGKKAGDKKAGFGWEFYAPFFADLQKKDFLDTYCHIIYASSEDDANTQWIKDNSCLKKLTTLLK
ncbi:MAG: tetratricopeptide repeat protein [Sphingobacteriales bacterium]|nr:MAG: tetratricopeptide repeat protein [Sphingobacteriales bacterium]